MPFTQPWLEVNFGTAYAGLVGTVGYRLFQSNDADSVARTTAGIVEIGTNTGCYGVVPPSIPDNAVGIEWDTGGGSPVSATEDLEPYRRRALVQAKLPTNYIMGSSDQADVDTDVDTLLARLTAARAAALDEITAARMAELDAANLPADIDTLLSRLTAARALLLDEITAARMAELDPANIPADIDTLLSRLTAARALLLDEITAARMQELDPANLPADIDTLLSRLTAARALLLDEITALRMAELDAANMPADIDSISSRLPAALVGGRMDSDVAVLQANVIDAASIATSALAAIATYLETTGTNPHGTGAWDATAVVPQQDIRDAMLLAPTPGAPAAGSVDEHLDDILADTNETQGKLPTNNIMGSSDKDDHDTDIDTLVARLTAARAAALDEVTAARMAELDAVNIPADIDTLLARLTAARAGYLDELDAANIPADIDTLLSRLSAARALLLDNLDQSLVTMEDNIRGVDDRDLSELAGSGWVALTDTLEAIAAAIAAGAIDSQAVRDAMKLAPTAGVPAAGSIDQHLDDSLAQHTVTQTAISGLNDIAASDIKLVKQTYVLDRVNDRLEGQIWLEGGDGQIVTSPTAVSVDVRDEDHALLFTMTGVSTGGGFYKVSEASPGLTTGDVFRAVASVTVPAVGVLTSGYGMFTVG